MERPADVTDDPGSKGHYNIVATRTSLDHAAGITLLFLLIFTGEKTNVVEDFYFPFFVSSALFYLDETNLAPPPRLSTISPSYSEPEFSQRPCIFFVLVYPTRLQQTTNLIAIR